MSFCSHTVQRRATLVASALTLMLIAVAAWGSPRAGAVSDSEELFSILLGQGEGAGEARELVDAASNPATGHFYLSDAAFARIDEFTPWGAFVKAIGWDVAPGPVNEQEEIRVKAAKGEFRLGFEGATTPSIPLAPDAEAAQAADAIEKALEGLPTIGSVGGEVSVTASRGTGDGLSPYIYVVAFRGSLAGKDVGQMTVEPGDEPLSGGQPATSAEVLTRVNGGPVTAGLEACTAESGCKRGIGGSGAGQFGAPGSLEFAGGNLYMKESSTGLGVQAFRVQELTPSGEFVRMFGGDVISDGASGTGTLVAGSSTVGSVTTQSKFFEVGQTLTGAGIPPATTITGVGPGTITLSKAATATASGVSIVAPTGAGNVAANERLTFAIEGSLTGAEPSGGTFRLGFSTPNPSPSQATAEGIPLAATAGEVEAKLAELPNLDATDVVVTGAAGGPWTVEFVGPRFGDSAPPRLEVDTKELTPLVTDNGSPYGVSIAEETAPEVCEDASSCRAGVPGVGPGEFNGGTFYFGRSGGSASGFGIAATPAGIAVADHDRIQQFALDGTHLNDISIPGKSPASLAAAPAGRLWVYLNIDAVPGGGNPGKWVPAAVELDGDTGLQLAEIPLSEHLGRLATDSDGTLYAGWAPARSDSGFEPDRVNQYAANLQPLSPASCCLAPLTSESGGHYGQGSLVTNSVGDLLVRYVGEPSPLGGQNLLKLFGPAPVRLEPPPTVPPTIASQFAKSVQPTEATISGLINPHFWTDARVYVEYGTGTCSTGGCTQKKPLPPGELLTAKPTGSLVKAPGVILEGLAPSTVYHYRLVAESGGGGPVAGIGGTKATPGEESTFTTASLRREGKPDCPNSAFRTGFSSPLPDCRAYEMVSPVDKNGGDVKTLLNFFSFSNAVDQSAQSGDSFTFSSYRAFADPASAAMTNQYMAFRQGTGWATAPITPPQALNSSGPPYQTNVNFDNMYRAFSPSLCEAWLFVGTEPALAPDASKDQPALYRRQNCANAGRYETLAQSEPSSGLDNLEVELQGMSADGQTIVVRSRGDLTPGSSGGNKARAYWINQGQTAPVCILPDGSPFAGDCSLGTAPNLPGKVAQGDGNRLGAVSHAISADGSKVYWTALIPESSVIGRGTIYLRENPGAEQSASGGCDEPGKACTMKVSETKSAAPARFLAASADGSKALYMFDEQGTPATPSTLYEFDAEEGASRTVAKKSLGYLAGSEDLSIFYFVSEEKLAGTTGATSAEPNLYVSQEGSTSFIATLSRPDARVLAQSNLGAAAVFHMARATSDGRTLAFLSTKSLTGYDNTDAASSVPCGVKEGSEEGICDSEVYLYEVGSESPVCVSCNPTGAQPEGRRGLEIGEVNVPYVVAGNLTAPTTQHYTPRNLSADGDRLFFDSYDSLLPRDTNGREDVYEWEAADGADRCEAMGAETYVAASGGCLSLISSGESSADSEFLDADPDGANAFFVTNASLLSQDPGLYDVYVARVGGGFPQLAVPSACEGEACQGPANPPTDPTPASSSFNGPGNVRQKSSHKHKHKHRKHRHKHKKKRHKAGHQRAQNDRRNG